MRSRAALAAIVIALVPLVARAQSAPTQRQIDDGHALARQMCMTCHVVSGAGTGSDAAPSFSTIAATRGYDYVRNWLMKPHGNMAPVDLTNGQMDALALYIESLRK